MTPRPKNIDYPTALSREELEEFGIKPKIPKKPKLPIGAGVTRRDIEQWKELSKRKDPKGAPVD